MMLSKAEFVDFKSGFFGWELANFGRWMSSVGEIRLALAPGVWSFRLFLKIQGAEFPLIFINGELLAPNWERTGTVDICSFQVVNPLSSDMKVVVYSRRVFCPIETGRSLDKRILGVWWEDRIEVDQNELPS
jgi:hypothetical protein